MTAILDNPAHWLQRAAEARAVADHFKDPETRAAMLGVAQTYEALAERAAERRWMQEALASPVDVVQLAER